MILPSIHLNGSGKDSLRRQYMDAYEKVFDAVRAVRGLDVHDRDYYVQSPEAGPQARAEKQDRVRRLEGVLDELETIIRHIDGA